MILKSMANLLFSNAFQIMKVASVIGDIFTKRQLLEVSESLTDSSLHVDEVIDILNELEARELIELVYEDNTQGDAIYRF
jgi:predicted ATPase